MTYSHSAIHFLSKLYQQSGVGRKSATSVGLTTDLVHWLQAGKTVDILRCATKSTDLLPPSALPRLLRSLRLSQPSRPAGCRLPAAAGHRAAVVDIADSGGPRRFATLHQRSCLCECYPPIGCHYPAILPYQRLQVPISIFSVTAIGDFETFDDSRLRRNFASVVCEGQCKPFVVEHSLRATAASRCEGRKVVSCGR